MKTKFINFKGEILALFPEQIADPQHNIMSYAHIGQHGAASPSLMRRKWAKPNEYKELLAELQTIYSPEPIELV
jgi:hypothetical protein